MVDHGYNTQAHFCKVIASTRRLQIITLLERGEMSVGDLAEQMNASLANVSQHLRVLRDNRIVRARRSGQTINYSLRDPRLPRACRELRSILMDTQKVRGENETRIGLE